MRPLEDIRVIDLTRVVAGPYCTMQLGDLGAEVIKIERPGHGDDARSFAPPYQGSESAYFLSINRNKKSAMKSLAAKDQSIIAPRSHFGWARGRFLPSSPCIQGATQPDRDSHPRVTAAPCRSGAPSRGRM